MELMLQKCNQDGMRARQMIDRENRQSHSDTVEESMMKVQQTDAKVKKAEKFNSQLNSELEQLKTKLNSLMKSKSNKEGLGEFSQFFHDDLDVSMISGVNRTIADISAIGSPFDISPAGQDPHNEYNFKIHLIEHDLQAAQSDNNNLVQSVLKLKQELREKRSVHDDVAMKILGQKIDELKRTVKVSDEKFHKADEEVSDLKEKIASLNDIMLNRSIAGQMGDEKHLKEEILSLEKSNFEALEKIKKIRDRNRAKEVYINSETKKKEDQELKESFLNEETSQKILDLKSKIRIAEEQLARYDSSEKSSNNILEGDASPDSLATLQETNHRLIGEIMRLNGVIKEHKKQASFIKHSIDVSGIKFNEESFNNTFLSKF